MITNKGGIPLSPDDQFFLFIPTPIERKCKYATVRQLAPQSPTYDHRIYDPPRRPPARNVYLHGPDCNSIWSNGNEKSRTDINNINKHCETTHINYSAYMHKSILWYFVLYVSLYDSHFKIKQISGRASISRKPRRVQYNIMINLIARHVSIAV